MNRVVFDGFYPILFILQQPKLLAVLNETAMCQQQTQMSEACFEVFTEVLSKDSILLTHDGVSMGNQISPFRSNIV
jgi:hypothetical protein